MDDFLKDMTATERTAFQKLDVVKQHQSYKHWLRSEGLHFNYAEMGI